MDELSVISLTYEVYKKLALLNTTIDKKYRHILGESATANCAEILKYLIHAKHAPKAMKVTYLVQADAYAELTTLQIRAILELHLANETNILKIQARLNEARKQIGGWRKSLS